MKKHKHVYPHAQRSLARNAVEQLDQKLDQTSVIETERIDSASGHLKTILNKSIKQLNDDE